MICCICALIFFRLVKFFILSLRTVCTNITEYFVIVQTCQFRRMAEGDRLVYTELKTFVISIRRKSVPYLLNKLELRKYLLFLLGLTIFMFVFIAKLSSSSSSTRLVVINDFKFAEHLNYSIIRRHDPKPEVTMPTKSNICRPLSLVGPLRIQDFG